METRQPIRPDGSKVSEKTTHLVAMTTPRQDRIPLCSESRSLRDDDLPPSSGCCIAWIWAGALSLSVEAGPSLLPSLTSIQCRVKGMWWWCVYSLLESVRVQPTQCVRRLVFRPPPTLSWLESRLCVGCIAFAFVQIRMDWMAFLLSTQRARFFLPHFRFLSSCGIWRLCVCIVCCLTMRDWCTVFCFDIHLNAVSRNDSSSSRLWDATNKAIMDIKSW